MKTQVYLHNTKLVMTKAEREAFEEALEFYLDAGYPEDMARQYAWDEYHINREVNGQGIDKYLEGKYGV